MDRMSRKPLSGEDVQLLNEQILSHDPDKAELAKRILFDALHEADRFTDSTAAEWASRIARRIKHTCHH